MMQLRKGFLIIIVLFLVSGIFLAVGIQTGFIGSRNDVVAKVNGRPVHLREFNQRILEYRAEVFSYFHQKYGATDSKNFWTRSIHGEVPEEMVKKKALEASVRLKVEQMLAVGQGLLKDDSYEAFLKSLSEENKRRKKALKNNAIIYGPEQYNEEEFFDYTFSNMQIRLKSKLAEKELSPSEADLMEMYEVQKDSKYRNPDSIIIHKIVIPLVYEAGTVSDEQMQKTRDKMKEIKLRLDAGEDFDRLARIYNQDGTVREQSFEPKTAREDSIYFSGLQKEAYSLSPGQTSGILELDKEMEILLCVSRKGMGYQSFEEVKGNIRSDFIDEKFEEMIDALVKKAEVEVNEKVYNAI